MRIKAVPEDFIVEEKIKLPFVEHGAHAIFRVHKRAVTTMDVQEQLAKQLRVGKERIAFPALKDKDAIATQYVSVQCPASNVERLISHRASHGSSLKSPTSNVQSPTSNFDADFVGYAARALQPTDLRGNAFTLVVRDLSLDEAQHIGPRLKQMAEYGVPNYFDEQRFGSFAGESGFIGKEILQRDAEGAVKIYLSEQMVGDPERVRVFKEFAHEHWGDWSALMERAPKPSNFRSVLTYLKDHPTDGYRKALNLIPHRLLTLYLSAYQSWLWNLIAGRYIASSLAGLRFTTCAIRVAGGDLPIYLNLPESLRLTFERLLIPLPNHRATVSDPKLAQAANEVLAQEGLTLNDFKARILKKAFAAKSARALVVKPTQISISDVANDELARKRWKVTLKFFLPPGSYATLLVKSL